MCSGIWGHTYLKVPCLEKVESLDVHDMFLVENYMTNYLIALFQANVTKYHRLGGLNSTHLLATVLGGCKSRIKVLTLSLPGDSPPAFQSAAFWLYLHLTGWKGRGVRKGEERGEGEHTCSSLHTS